MKLHPDTVRELRRYHSRGYSIASLVEAYKLSRTCVNGVVKYRTHRGITEDDSFPPLVVIERQTIKRRPNEAKPIPPIKQSSYQEVAKQVESRSKAQEHYDRIGKWPPWWDEVREMVKLAITHQCPCGFEAPSSDSVWEHMHEAHPRAVAEAQAGTKRCPVCRSEGLLVTGTLEKIEAHIKLLHPKQEEADAGEAQYE